MGEDERDGRRAQPCSRVLSLVGLDLVHCSSMASSSLRAIFARTVGTQVITGGRGVNDEWVPRTLSLIR